MLLKTLFRETSNLKKNNYHVAINDNLLFCWLFQPFLFCILGAMFLHVRVGLLWPKCYKWVSGLCVWHHISCWLTLFYSSLISSLFYVSWWIVEYIDRFSVFGISRFFRFCSTRLLYLNAFFFHVYLIKFFDILFCFMIWFDRILQDERLSVRREVILTKLKMDMLSHWSELYRLFCGVLHYFRHRYSSCTLQSKRNTFQTQTFP